MKSRSVLKRGSNNLSSGRRRKLPWKIRFISEKYSFAEFIASMLNKFTHMGAGGGGEERDQVIGVFIGQSKMDEFRIIAGSISINKNIGFEF